MPKIGKAAVGRRQLVSVDRRRCQWQDAGKDRSRHGDTMTALILSHQRCGSSNLTRFIRSACAAKADMEIFNGRILNRRLPHWREASDASVSEHITTELSGRDVVKHIYGQDERVDRLLVLHSNAAPILFLWRASPEAAALSSLIAKHVGDFNKSPDTDLPPIPLDAIRRTASEIEKKKEAAMRLIRESEKRYLPVRYEDLFDNRAGRRKAMLDNIISFLGLGAHSDYGPAFAAFMSGDHKINSADTYSRIANFRELTSAMPTIFD